MATKHDEIAPEDVQDESDDYEDDTGFASQRSLATSITHYRYENGRRYHAYREGQYWQPNDDKIKDQELLTHHLFLLSLHDKLTLAPLSNPRRVIDIGTGTGIWAQDFAEQFPDAEVIGTDLSPIQPDYSSPNLRFEIDDCCSTWTYPADHFDFIHIRCMYGSVEDWPAFYAACYEHLRPGAYIEQAEISVRLDSEDPTVIAPGSIYDAIFQVTSQVQEIGRRTFSIQERCRSLIEEAGFVDVVEKKIRWPVGGWMEDEANGGSKKGPIWRDFGRWNLQRWCEGLEGWDMALCTRVLGWSYEQVKAFNADVRTKLRAQADKEIFQNVSVVYARKPFPGELRPP